MTPEQREEVIRLYVEESMSTKQVGRQLHLGDPSVRNLLIERGLMRTRADYGDLSLRQRASQARVPLEEFKRQTARGLKHCTPCSREAGEPIWHLAREMSRDRNCVDGYAHTCLEQRRKRAGHCMDKRNRCGVRWGNHQHRHCSEPLRVMADGTVHPCDQPMVLDADRCATCESLLLLQERIAQLEAELQLRTGRRLPSLVDDPRDPIPRGELSA